MNDHSKEEYESDLKARLDILRTKLNDGKINIAPHLIEGFKSSLANIQYSENGDIRPLAKVIG